ncbi:hypothetical protein IJE86_04265 [bacterium]|nr:hypothetical protein [bacterium]
MDKIIYKLISKLIQLKEFTHKKRMARFSSTKTYTNGTSKTIFHGAQQLILASQTEAKKQELNQKVKAIVKEKLNDPEKLLNFIQDEGTDVYRLPNVDIFLQLIGEEEGFIPRTKNLKAILLNLYVNFVAHKKIVISLRTSEMFILRPLPLDPYYMIHQFHMWYGYKLGLPGYSLRERENFKKIFKSMKKEDISSLTISEVIALKETIARDKEAIDFVINLAKEYDSSKKLVNKIRNGQSVKL